MCNTALPLHGFLARADSIRRGRCAVIALIFLALMCAADVEAADPPSVTFGNGLNLSKHLSYIEDRAGTLSIEDVALKTGEWAKNTSGFVNFGYSPSVYWFRADIRNGPQAEGKALLEVDFPSLDYVELYSPDKAGGWSAVCTGDRRNFDSRPIRDPNFLFPLDLGPDVTTVYLRVRNAGSLRFNARLYSERGYIERKNSILPRLWLLYGMLVLVAAFYFFIFALLRDRVYLYFALFSSILFLYQISHRGYAFQFLWPGNPEWANIALPVFMNLSGMMASFFIRSVMETRSGSPRFDRLLALSGFIVFPLSVTLAFIIPLALYLQVTYMLLMVFTAAVIIYFMTALRKGDRFAGYFIAGLGGVAVFAVIGTLTAFGRLPLNFLTEWSTELGFLWLVFAASGGMIERMKALTDGLKSSKIEQEKNIELLTRANQELAATNEELNAAMEELSATNEEFEAQNEELIAAENELKASEEKYRNLVENINEAIYSIDAEGVIIYISPAIEKIIGFTATELSGMRFQSLIPREDLEFVTARFSELALGEIKPSVYRIRTKAGEYRWVTSISRPIFRKGCFVGANGVLTDIHERKEAEDRVLQERNFATTIIDTLPGIFFIMDGKGTLVRWKGRIKGDDAFGYGPEEVRSMSALEMVEPRDRDIAAAKLHEAFVKGQTSVEITFMRKNGDRLAFHVAVSRMRLDGEDYLIGIGFEITDRKRAEEECEKTRIQLIQAQKMEAIGTLAGGIAHDFNNMLMGIMGSLDLIRLILNRDGQVDRSAILNYIEIALESSRRSAEMTRRLLTLSRKSGLQAVPMDINETIAAVYRLCRNTLSKSVKLDFREAAEPLRVKAEPLQIEQVLLNLCVNAAHAMTIMRPAGEREGGTLTVSASLVRPTDDFISQYPIAGTGGVYVMLSVKDTGVGIEEQARSQIFDPFFTTKRKDVGTGLGLAMAYTIVQQHGGFIDVASTPGEGSVFTVYLPALDEAREHPVPDAGEPVAGEGRILLVDDEKPVLGIAAGMLERLGYEVTSAESASEAMELFERAHGDFTAVILDLSMPGMSGLEVYEKMRAFNPAVRVLLASGFVEDSVLADAMNSGIVGFIQKPFTITELSLKVKQVATPDAGNNRSD